MIQALLKDKPTMRLWVNDNGTCFRGQITKDPKNSRCAIIKDLSYLAYGLGEGVPDIVGLDSVEITEEWCKENLGKRVAIFVAIEVKTENDVLRPKQRQCIEIVNELGGKAGVAYSIEQAKEIVCK